MLIQRSSSAPASRTDIVLASSSAVTASAKRTPCLRRFAAAFAGSHSTSILCTIVHRWNVSDIEQRKADHPATVGVSICDMRIFAIPGANHSACSDVSISQSWREIAARGQ